MKLSAVVMLLCLMLGACAQKQKIPAATYMGGNHTITEICKELDTAGASHVDTFREWVTDFADSAGKNAKIEDVWSDPENMKADIGKCMDISSGNEFFQCCFRQSFYIKCISAYE